MPSSRLAALGFAAIAFLGARSVLAEPNAFLFRAIPDLPLRPHFTMVRGPTPAGAHEIVPGLSVFEGDPSVLRATGVDVELHPPLTLKLDVSLPFIGGTVAHDAGLDGRGTYVGIVDTGVDILHRAFRKEDGTTRIGWFLDMGDKKKRAGNADDEKYGGRVWSRAELDSIIAGNKVDNSPTDNDGHGTHVAGIAAGNGGLSKKYVGVASGADLIAVRASDPSGAIEEGAAVLGAKFVFDRAAEEGKPAVVNLSLGTQYGAHDGTSSFERALVALTGKGRAVVVAASNEGGTPIHTSVRVTPGTPYRIPIRLYGSDGRGAQYSSGRVFIWINARDRGDLRVSVRGPGGEVWIDPVEKGRALQTRPVAGVQLIVSNELQTALQSPNTSGAVVWLIGALPVGEFELELSGDTATEIWLQGMEQAIDGPGMPLFVRGGQIEGTIGVPASAPGLISVGSVTARTGYQKRDGTRFTIDDATIGERSYFSSAGPSANGALRPDILAPGHFVISALARNALLAAPNGQFGEDQVIDPDHGALAGTSMSSPFGAGAIALLFQKDPTLTHEDVRALLQAGARPLADDPREGASPRDYAKGAGILDIQGALTALERKGAAPRATSLFMRLGASYLAADGGLPLSVLVLARDGAGRPADTDLSLDLTGARSNGIEHPAVGLYRFAVTAEPGLGGKLSTIGVRGSLSLSRTVPIAVDRWDARDGIHGGGGCAMAASETSAPALLIVVFTTLRTLRARSRARERAARRGGTGAADRRC